MERSIHSSGLESFLAFVFTGIKGTITDAQSGDPIGARIQIEPEGAPVFTDPQVGDYHRIALPGVYTITAFAPGYTPKTVRDIAVPSYGHATVDIAL